MSNLLFRKVEPQHRPKGRVLVVDETIAHLTYAMEIEDHEWAEYLTSLITGEEFRRHTLEDDPLRMYLEARGIFRTPLPRPTKKGVNQNFNPRIF